MKHKNLIIQYQDLLKTVAFLEKDFFSKMDDMEADVFLSTDGEIENLKKELNKIESLVDRSVTYFYSSKHGGQKVSIYEATARYDSGFVMIGHCDIDCAIRMHNNWVWLSSEYYKNTEDNFKKEGE